MTLAQIESIPAQEAAEDSHDRLLRREGRAITKSIMIVDDEPINIKVVQKLLKSAGYEDFITTSDSREALNIIRQQHPDVVVLDIMMPHISGIHILEAIRGDRELCHLPVLFLTAAADEETKSYALELGATDFLTKPVKPTELIPRIKNALVLKAHHDQMTAYSRRLEEDVRQRTAELVRSREEVIHVLACAAEYRDKETGNHVLRVGRFAGLIARELGFSEYRSELIEQAAILHDVGKIGIPDAILLKPAKLDEGEIEHMKRHCEYGRNILHAQPSYGSQDVFASSNQQEFRSPILRIAATITMSHHEQWDGSGYPQGLSGEAIPIEGRVTAVADVFDALSCRRPYKAPIPLDRCFEMLQQGRGKHFDPQVLDAFVARKDEVVRVAVELADE